MASTINSKKLTKEKHDYDDYVDCRYHFAWVSLDILRFRWWNILGFLTVMGESFYLPVERN